MIPAPFAYARPSTVDEALQAVASGGEDVKILAGGQSLIPVMRLRLAAPETVVDLTRVAELRGVRDDGDALAIGAMTTASPSSRTPRSSATLVRSTTVSGAASRSRMTGISDCPPARILASSPPSASAWSASSTVDGRT